MEFSEIENEFMQRVRDKVWCSVATVDRAGRPRSRVLHPVWEGATGWVLTNAGSHKAKHLAANAYLSCAYVDAERPMYVDCHAAWVDDPAEKRRVWEFVKAQTPEPYGYDPAFIWQSAENERLAVLRLTPWRIEIVTALAGQLPERKVWRG
jgi:general stress protein 26